MRIWGKTIGTLLGFVLGRGVVGAAVGLAVGHWIDLKMSPKQPRPNSRKQAVFTRSVVMLGAKLAKADGPVTQAEVDAFTSLFHIPPSQKSAIADLWDEAKATPDGYEPHAEALGKTFADTPFLLAELLAALQRIALADGPLTPPEETFLRRVAEIFGVRPQNDTQDAYALLGVSVTAPFDEVKAAWRKLSREHHPDRLMAKGVPQEYIDLATQKMAEINAAYDRIRTERGEH